MNAIRVFYSIPADRAQERVSNALIIHPYGQVGKLNWQHGGDTPFGAEVESGHLVKISQQIRTFTEQHEDPDLQSAIQETLTKASTAVFLGFAYHEINMSTLKLGVERNISRVYGTAFGMSPSDVQSATRDVRNSICILDADVLLNNNIKSFELFNEYWRTLPK
jgi:hypothetical protein